MILKTKRLEIYSTFCQFVSIIQKFCGGQLSFVCINVNNSHIMIKLTFRVQDMVGVCCCLQQSVLGAARHAGGAAGRPGFPRLSEGGEQGLLTEQTDGNHFAAFNQAGHLYYPQPDFTQNRDMPCYAIKFVTYKWSEQYSEVR